MNPFTLHSKKTNKLLLLGLFISLFFQPVNCTFSDFEAGLIALQQDTLSWPQIGLLKTMFLILFKMWIHGALPIEVDVPLHKITHESRKWKEANMDIRPQSSALHNNPPLMKNQQQAASVTKAVITAWRKILNGLCNLLNSFIQTVISEELIRTTNTL